MHVNYYYYYYCYFSGNVDAHVQDNEYKVELSASVERDFKVNEAHTMDVGYQNNISAISQEHA